MPAYSRILLPWDSQPQEVVELNPEFPAIAGWIGGGAATQNIGIGSVEPNGIFSAGGGTFLGVGPQGLGIQAAGSTNDGLKLHSAGNQTNTIWERPTAQVSVAVMLRRFGNTGGNSPVFGNIHPTASPFSAWNIMDAGGAGTPSFQTSGGGVYTAISSSAVFGNNEDVVIAGTYDGATMRIYRNGVLTGSTAKTGAITYPNNASRGPAVGNFWGGFASRAFNGIIYGGILHDAAWSENVVKSISNPAEFWQLFAPRSIRVPVSAAGAPPTFIPSWARRQTRTIGAGVI